MGLEGLSTVRRSSRERFRPAIVTPTPAVPVSHEAARLASHPLEADGTGLPELTGLG
jgi:hypothetical protein